MLKDYLASLKGKKVVVLGVGVSNRPLLELLSKSEALVEARDKKNRDELLDIVPHFEEANVSFVLGDKYLDDIDADIIFRTPSLRPDAPGILQAVKNGALLTGEMEVFFDLCPCPIIAITGSDGKTTTTSLVARMLETAGKKVWLGGNIGTPLLSITDEISPDDFAVVELSSFQLMTMGKSASRALITNLAPNHLDIHKDMDEYIACKCNVFAHQKSSDITVLNLDNDITRSLAPSAVASLRFFSMHDSSAFAYLNGDTIFLNHDGCQEAVIKISDITIPGMHNVENCLAACALLQGICSPQAMAKTMVEFTGVAHRLEFVRELDGVRYYNDSIGTSPSRTMAGLSCFENIVLIAGGYDKHIPFDRLGAEIPKKVKKLLLCGATADKIEEAVLSSPLYKEGSPEIFRYSTLKEAILGARELACPKDVVLLSPACAAFDQFPNFSVRGDFFRKTVNELI